MMVRWLESFPELFSIFKIGDYISSRSRRSDRICFSQEDSSKQRILLLHPVIFLESKVESVPYHPRPPNILNGASR
jgi:hypothetical protein